MSTSDNTIGCEHQYAWDKKEKRGYCVRCFKTASGAGTEVKSHYELIERIAELEEIHKMDLIKHERLEREVASQKHCYKLLAQHYADLKNGK